MNSTIIDNVQGAINNSFMAYCCVIMIFGAGLGITPVAHANHETLTPGKLEAHGGMKHPVTCYDGGVQISFPFVGTISPFAQCKVEDLHGTEYKITGPQTLEELLKLAETCGEHNKQLHADIVTKTRDTATIGQTTYCR